jgi:sulfur-carrier protein
MQVEVRLYAGLRSTGAEGAGPRVVTLREGTSVVALLNALGIPQERVKVVFVNARHAPPGHVLQEGDRVGIFPPAGGG